MEESLPPVLPWKVRVSLTALGLVVDHAGRSDGTVNQLLRGMFDAASTVGPNTGEGVKVTDTIIDTTRKLWFRLYVPTEVSEDAKLPVLVFFHGGGFSFLSPSTREYDFLCRQFAQNIPAIVVSVNYRLAPENRYPAPYDDGFDALKFLDRKMIDSFATNADLSRCFIAGDSAGGNIAHHVALRVAGAETEFSELRVIGLIAMQPFFGGVERTDSEIRLKRAIFLTMERSDWFWKAFLPEGADRDHEGANVFSPNTPDMSALESFPATLVFVGGFDPLQDRQKQYYEGLRRFGKKAKLVEYPNAIHSFYVFPELPEAALLLAEVRNFIHSNGDSGR